MDVELIDSSIWTGILRTVSPEASHFINKIVKYSLCTFCTDGHCSKCCPPKKEYKKQTGMLKFLFEMKSVIYVFYLVLTGIT